MERFDINTAQRGQEVAQEVYEYFLNILPPRSINGGQGYFAGFQVGEAYSHELDTRTGKLRPMYATFVSRDGKYYYMGINFPGEVNSDEFVGK